MTYLKEYILIKKTGGGLYPYNLIHKQINILKLYKEEKLYQTTVPYFKYFVTFKLRKLEL